MGDNVSTNDTLCAAIRKHILKVEDREWNDIQWRVRCTGHIINLAVQAFLFQDTVEMEDLELYDKEEQESMGETSEDMRQKFRLLGPLGQLHNIVIHSRASSYRIEDMKGLAKRGIPLDNYTRWNSWDTMLIITLKH